MAITIQNDSADTKQAAKADTVTVIQEAPAGRDVLLRFDGPARSYNYAGLRFARKQVLPVPESRVEHLMATRLFSRATADQLASQERGGGTRDVPKYRVGDFKSKAEAAAYASNVHGIVLDSRQSLKAMNQQTISLAKARRGGQDGPDVEYV